MTTTVDDDTPACEECGNDLGPYEVDGQHFCLDCLESLQPTVHDHEVGQ